jgi:hypothetical protein
MKILDAAQKQFTIHALQRGFPACFRNEDQYEAWSEVEAIAHTKPRALPCRDCLPAFQSQMAAEGRCAVAGIPRIARIMDKAQPEAA